MFRSQLLIVGITTLLVLVNIAAMVLYGVDKWRSRKAGLSRVPERTLIAVAALGGSLGAMLGMLCFRHKTMHWKFMLLVPLFLLIHIALVGYVIYMVVL